MQFSWILVALQTSFWHLHQFLTWGLHWYKFSAEKKCLETRCNEVKTVQSQRWHWSSFLLLACLDQPGMFLNLGSHFIVPCMFTPLRSCAGGAQTLTTNLHQLRCFRQCLKAITTNRKIIDIMQIYSSVIRPRSVPLLASLYGRQAGISITLLSVFNSSLTFLALTANHLRFYGEYQTSQQEHSSLDLSNMFSFFIKCVTLFLYLLIIFWRHKNFIQSTSWHLSGYDPKSKPALCVFVSFQHLSNSLVQQKRFRRPRRV